MFQKICNIIRYTYMKRSQVTKSF